MNHSITSILLAALLLAACADEVDTDQQQLSSGYVSVGQTEVTLSGQGATQTVSVSANTPRTATSSEQWLIVTPASGNASANITLECQANTSVTADRTATVTIATADGLHRSISVRQQKNDETLRFNAETLVFAAAGEAKSLVIESNAQWEIMGAGDWLTLSTTTGQGNSEITITAEPNPLETERSATLTIRGTTLSDRVVITQEGRATTLAASPTELTFDAMGSQKEVSLVGDATWQASSSVEWLTLSQKEGTGAAVLTLSCADNATDAPRTAAVTIKTLRLELTISITQLAGQRPVLTQPVASAIGRETATLSSSSQSIFEVTGYGFTVSRQADDIGTAYAVDQEAQGSFTLQLTGLTSHATYYIRAYATNKVGTAYSDPIAVTTEGTVPGEDDNIKPNL